MTSLGETSRIRFIPSGVISKAHGMTSVIGRLSKIGTTTAQPTAPFAGVAPSEFGEGARRVHAKFATMIYRLLSPQIIVMTA